MSGHFGAERSALSCVAARLPPNTDKALMDLLCVCD